jgi:hypothetical protein
MRSHVGSIRMLASNDYLWNSQGERFTKAMLEGRLRLYENWWPEAVASVQTQRESRAEGRGI